MKTITRKAEASWEGNLDSGHGFVSTESRVLVESQYTAKQRFGGEGKTTNPEELIAAAAASCFAMAFSKTLQDDNVISEEILVHASVMMTIRDEGPKVTHLKLRVEAIIADYSEEQLEAAVSKTAENCPIFQLLKPGFESVDLSSALQR